MVTFAEAEYHGGVYQAAGWIYTGTTTPDWRYTDRDGKTRHSRNVSTTGFKSHMGHQARVPRPDECTRERIPGKHRFVMPLDDEIAKVVEPYRKTPPAREA